MKTIFLASLLSMAVTAWGQSEPTEKFPPIIVTLRFQNFSMPFKDLGSHFKHLGISIGTQLPLSKNGLIAQQIHLGGHINREMGNGLTIFSQSVIRPTMKSAFAEAGIGVGYALAFRPSQGWRIEDGKWVKSSSSPKGMLLIPVSLAVGKKFKYGTTVYRPFLGYQFNLVKGYNRDLPLTPESIIRIGSTITFEK